MTGVRIGDRHGAIQVSHLLVPAAELGLPTEVCQPLPIGYTMRRRPGNILSVLKFCLDGAVLSSVAVVS